MEGLRQWLLGIVCCAMIVSLLRALTPEGAIREIARFAGGLVLILGLLRPLGTVDPARLALSFDELSARRAAVEEQYGEESAAVYRAVIAARTGAYIEDKATQLGGSVQAAVETREENGAILPDRVILTGQENDALSDWIARELAIPRERQEWRKPA